MVVFIPGMLLVTSTAIPAEIRLCGVVVRVALWKDRVPDDWNEIQVNKLNFVKRTPMSQQYPCIILSFGSLGLTGVDFTLLI
jgi:hypothetical protein